MTEPMMGLSLLVWLLVMVGLVLLLRRSPGRDHSPEFEALQQQLTGLQAQNERLERELRNEVTQTAVQARQENMQTLTLFQQSLLQQSAEASRTQNQQMDALAQQLALLQKSLTDSLALQVQGLSEANARRLAETVSYTHLTLPTKRIV